MLVNSSAQNSYAGPFSHALRRTDFRCQMFSYISLILKNPKSQLGWTSFPSIDLTI